MMPCGPAQPEGHGDPPQRGGRLIREDWHWSLLFTPNRSEKRTLDDSSDLYQVLCSLAQRRQDGEVCRVAVPDRSLKTLVSGSDPFCILDEFCKSQPGGYLAVARTSCWRGRTTCSAMSPSAATGFCLR